MAAPQNIVGERLEALRERANRAVVYIGPGPGSITFCLPVHEKDLPRIGCTYEIEKQNIDELVTLLGSDPIAIQRQQHMIAPRNGVLIYDGEQLLLKLIFGNAYTGERGMRGLLDGEVPVMSGPTLQSELRAFAERFTPVRKNNGCEKGGVAIGPVR